MVDGEPNVKLTHFDNGYIRCRVDSNYVGNVNVTFATSFNGQSATQKNLYSIGGDDFELFNFQLIPAVDSIDKHSGSTAGGNILTLAGGPFIAGETVVDIGGSTAKILALSQDELVIEAPSKPQSACGNIGQRGFTAKVWDQATMGTFRPIGISPTEMQLSQATFVKKGHWTAHLEGFFKPPSSGYYSFVLASSHSSQLFFGNCDSDAKLVATAEYSESLTSFFNDDGNADRLVMDKVYLEKGQSYYLRAEGYSLYGSAYKSAGFLNIGALFHSTTGSNQATMSYRTETQTISIVDQFQPEIQEISFASNNGFSLQDSTAFTLTIDGRTTREFTLDSEARDIENELNALSASTCVDRGHINAAYRADMENPSGVRHWRQVRPFCGSRTYALGGRKNVVFSDDAIDLNINPHVCFAYLGDVGEKVTVTVEAGKWRTVRSYDINIGSTTTWKFTCINLLSDYLLKDPVVNKKLNEKVAFNLKKFQFSLPNEDAKAYIDEFIIGRVEGFFEVERTSIGIAPGGGYIQRFDVGWSASDGLQTLRVGFNTDSCGLTIDLFELDKTGADFEEIQDPLTHFYTFPSYTVKVDRQSKISPGVVGNFDLAYSNKILSASVGWNARQLQQKLSSVFGSEFATAKLTKKGDCRSGYTYQLKWDSYGDKDQIELQNVAVTGINIDASVKTVNDGGLLVPYLTQAMLARPSEAAQVHVFVRDIMARCDNCDYEWRSDQTVDINSVDQVSGDVWSLTGGQFAAGTKVLVGGQAATIQSIESNLIVFTLPEVSGRLSVETFHADSGFSSTKQFIEVPLQIESVTPLSTGTGGGEVVKVNGAGFNEATTVTIGNVACEPRLITYDIYACDAPALSAGSYEIKVNDVAADITLTYDETLSPEVSHLSKNKVAVYGGEIVTISGANFGSQPTVYVGDIEASVVSSSDTEVVIETPKNKPGSFAIKILGARGFSTVNKKLHYQLVINSAWPKMSSVAGGALLTVKGAGFGNAENTAVLVGETQCEIETVEPKQLSCRVGKSVKEHIVENGVVTVAGVPVYSWTPRSIIVQLGERVTWRWNIPLSSSETPKVRIQQTLSDGRVEYNGVGFQSPVFKGQSGEWSYDFLVPGTYYYSSGYVESSQTIALTGTIVVEEVSSAVSYPVYVSVDGHIAEHDMIEDLVSAHEENTCDTLFNEDRSEQDERMVSHTFAFDKTPLITGIRTQKVMRPSGLLTITAEGLSEHLSCLKLSIGGFNCNFEDISEPVDITSSELDSLGVRSRGDEKRPTEEIQCRLEHRDEMPVGELCGIKAHIERVGDVLITSDTDDCIEVEPVVRSLRPKSGSAYGGQLIDIRVEGVDTEDTDDVSVRVGDSFAEIVSVSYNIIQIRIPEPNGIDAHDYADIIVSVSGHTLSYIGDDELRYKYDATRTPMIQKVDRLGKSIMIDGVGFVGDVTVRIDEYECKTTSVSASFIQCYVEKLPAGSYHPTVVSSTYGTAGLVTQFDTLITLEPEITSVSPRQGSLRGGNLITIKGLGFTDTRSMRVSWDRVKVEKYEDEVVSATTDTLILRAPMNRNYELKSVEDGELRITMHTQSGDVTYPIQQYQFRADLMPKLSSCSPSVNIIGGQTLTISAEDVSCSTVSIEVGDAPCEIVSCNTSVTSRTILTCKAPFVSAGDHLVTINDKKFGYGVSDTIVSFGLKVDKITPSTGALGGNQLVEIHGTGLSSEAVVTICGAQCEVVDSDESLEVSSIQCRTSSSSIEQVCDVTVNGEVQDVGFMYELTSTPIVKNVSPNRGQVNGGTLITIDGFNLASGETQVSIGEYPCTIESATENRITCTTGPSDGSQVASISVDNGFGQQQDVFQYWYVNRWSSPRSWGCDDNQAECPGAPADGDIIEIPEGIELLLDESTPLLAVLIVNGGKLIFDREADIHLRAHYIIINNGGSIQVGSEHNPYKRQAHIELYGHRRSIALPLYGAKVLAIHRGSLDLHGIPHRFTWTRLDGTVEAGSDKITLVDEPNDWNVGDSIVIASTGGIDTVDQNEEVKIVEKNGNTVTIEPPLRHRHLGVVKEYSGKTIDMRAEVGLLTRNVKVSGNQLSSWLTHHEPCPIERKDDMDEIQTCFLGKFGEETASDEFGAQMHFGPGTKHVRLSNVEVFNAGQAFELGRYPIHFHMVGNVESSYVKQCSIHHTFNRALTFHAVQNLRAEQNVAYHVKGHTFFLEDGIETRNELIQNLAIGTRASSSLLSTDLWAASFWITNPDNDYIGNVAAGGSHNGFWLNPPGKPTGPSFTRNACPRNAELGVFEGNMAHSMGLFGLWIYPFYTPTVNGDCDVDFQLAPQAAKFHNFSAYGCKRGAEGVFVTAVQWHDFIAVDNLKAGLSFMETKLKGWGPDSLLIKDSVIVGRSGEIDIEADPECVGLETPWKQGDFQVDGLEMHNFEGSCVAINPCYRSYQNDCSNQGRFQRIGWHNSPNKVIWAWENEYDFHDMDGTFTQTGQECHLLTHTGILPMDRCSVNHLPDFSLGKQNATICDATVKLHRFGLNDTSHDSLNGTPMTVRNQFGSFTFPWRDLRVTHRRGWIGVILDGYEHSYEFDGFDTLSNLTYNAAFEGFQEDDHAVMTRRFSDKIGEVKIDQYETGERSASILTQADNKNYDYFVDNDTGDVSYLVSGANNGAKSGGFNPGPVIQVEFAVKNSVADAFDEEEQLSMQEQFQTQLNCLWSDAACWRQDTASGDVIIPVDRHIWLDEAAVEVNGDLIIYGTLEFVPDQSYKISASNIVVYGRFAAGSENSPFPCALNIDIELTSTLTAPSAVADSPVPSGKRALVNFGQLELYGCSTTTRAKLLESVQPGESTLVLDRNPSWDEGDELVISSTSQDGAEAEKLTIASVSGNKIEVTNSVKFYHEAMVSDYDGKELHIQANIGSLTRNIRVFGNNESFEADKFGGRILITPSLKTTAPDTVSKFWLNRC